MTSRNSSQRSVEGAVDSRVVPRFAGTRTFARLPRIEDVDRYDVAVLGVPFDSGVTYRPGARFGPSAIRDGSRLLRPYHPALDVEPFKEIQVVDAGDVACTPFDIAQAVAEIENLAGHVLERGERLLALGGDHTIALPLLRATARRFGSVAVLHFDAHLDTWDGHFGAQINHGTPFRRASDEGLLLLDRCLHVGVRGPLYSRDDLAEDARLGFQLIGASEFEDVDSVERMQRIRARLGVAPIYVSVDIDVLDPSHAPGTGTPEAGGLTTREVLAVLRGLRGLNIVGADIVEVAPAYDHAEITAVAAAHIAYDLLALLATDLHD